MKSIKSQNYYEILGVDRSASPEEIRNAYDVAKHAFQDDSLATYSLFTDEENQEILALISRAYETLFNPDLRQEYDAFLDGLDREELPARDGRLSLQPRLQALRTQVGPPRARPGSPSAITRPNGPRPVSEIAPDPGAELGHSLAPEHDESTEKYIETVSCYTGPVLKKIRQMKGFSLEDVAERTKIRRTYIEYLEEEQFSFLPAPVYVKGFVTMIAGMLNLPAHRVAEDYMAYYRGQSQI